jgi:hypothetical protein
MSWRAGSRWWAGLGRRSSGGLTWSVCVPRQGHTKYAVEKAIALMLKKDDLAHRNQGRSVVRIR